MKKIFSKEVMIGFTVIVALVILFVGIDYLKGVNVFKKSNYYIATFDNVAGLQQSAPVTLNGFKVGMVSDIAYDYDNPGHVNVEISLDKELRLPEGSKALLVTDLLGTATIELQLGTSKNYCELGSKIPGEVPAGMMQKVSEDLMPSVAQIFPKVDSILTSLNTIVADPAISNSVKRLDAITANLEQTTVALNSLLATLPPITSDVKGVTSSLGTSASNVNQITGDLAELSANLKTMPIDSLVGDLHATVENLRELSEQLKDPNSTLGKLMNDPALYNNLNSTVSSLDSLFIDIKKNPKRYINIKLL